tara:strand:+ start:255 stop:548 length:294 start_codon:yes stop_codon:yes gene_type:complete
MERVEIHIDMRMLPGNTDDEIYDISIKAITRINNVDVQAELREAVYSIIEKEEDEHDCRFLFGEVRIHHKDQKKVYAIGNSEFMTHYQQEGFGETYH